MSVYFFISIFAFPVVLYGLLIIRYALVVPSFPEYDSGSGFQTKRKVSLIIPFRNEEENLNLLLESIDQQELAAESYEILFCDDYSSDDSGSIIMDYVKRRPNYFYLKPEGPQGKKFALDRAIMAARYDWIVQTDADTVLPAPFLRRHSEYAAERGLSFLAGPVMYHSGKNTWEKLEELEYLSLMASARASFYMHKPIMCSAGNMSYAKDLYLRNRDALMSSGSISGDDVFLMLAAKREESFRYMDGRDMVVYTSAAGTVGKFFRQRIRWASKTGLSKDRDIIGSGLLVFLANMSLFVLLPMMLFFDGALPTFGVLFLLKFGVDFLLLSKTARYYGRVRSLRYFPLLSLFYYIYVPVAAVLSQVVKIRWKERS